jgi:hypothetical protein
MILERRRGTLVLSNEVSPENPHHDPYLDSLLHKENQYWANKQRLIDAKID